MIRRALSLAWLGLALLLLLFFAPGLKSAAQIYVSVAGGGSGASCASPRAISSLVAGDWVAGNTIHLCGTITSQVIAQGSGSSGSPITVKFETGAKISMAFCPSNGCLSLDGRSWITVDGGTACGPVFVNGTITSQSSSCNGVIESTANGSPPLANQNTLAVGISIGNVTNIDIKNLMIQNMYRRTSTTDLVPSGGGPLPSSIYANGTANNVKFHDSVTHDANWLIAFVSGGVQTNTEVYNVETYNSGHAHAYGVITQTDNNLWVHNNWDHDHVAWNDPAGCKYHLDGIHTYRTSTGNITNIFYYNNVFSGDWGSCTSGMIFTEGLSMQMTLFNNYCDGNNITGATGNGCWNTTVGSGGTSSVYNNTATLKSPPANGYILKWEAASDIQNNVSGASSQILTNMPANVTVPAGKLIDYNAWLTTATFCQWYAVAQTSTACNGSAGYMNLTQWKAYILATYPSSGGEAHSFATAYPAGINANGTLQSTSPLRNVGHNLTSLCSGQPIPGIGALCSDITGAARPTGTTPWDIGAFQYVSTTSPSLSFSPSPVAFGNQNVGSTSSQITVTVTNSGTGNEVLSSPYYTIGGTNAGDFANAGGGTCANGGTITPSSSCTVKLTFTPSAVGSRVGTLTINGTVNGTVSLTGTGIGVPALSFSPSPVAFGNQNTNSTSSVTTVTVTNSGTGSEVLSTPYYTLGGTNAADFTNAGTGTCADGGTITVGSSCTVRLTFTPSTTGARTGTLTINGTVNNSVNLTGTGVVPALTFSPSSVSFSNQNISTVSSPITVTVTNSGTGSEVLSTPYYTVGGTNAGDFANTGGTCAGGGTIAAGNSCTLNMVFSPTATGSRTGTVTINGTVSNSFNLSGTGVVPILSFSPATPITFSNQLINTTSTSLTITVSNSGTGDELLATPYYTITGTNAGDFANAGGGTCADGGTIAIGNSCTVKITFTPSATGSRNALLTIAGVPSTANGVADLTGTGVVPALTFLPDPVSFADQNVSTTSSPLTVTLTNSGTSDEVLSTPYYSIGGTNAGDYANSGGGTCTNGGTITPGNSCTFNLTFTPSAVGSRVATVTINGTVSDSVNVLGSGLGTPALSFSPNPVSFANQNVNTTSAQTTLTVTNSGTGSEVLSNPYFTIGGTNAGDFANAGGGTCANDATITAGNSCTVKLTFTPSLAGSRAATITINGTVNGSVNLSGTGVGTPALSFSPNPVAFASQTVSTTSSPITVTVTNTGTGNEVLSNPYYTIGGTNGANFANSGGGTCANGGTITPSSSCTVNITFTPSATGARTGTLTINGTVNGVVSMTGFGGPPPGTSTFGGFQITRLEKDRETNSFAVASICVPTLRPAGKSDRDHHRNYPDQCTYNANRPAARMCGKRIWPDHHVCWVSAASHYLGYGELQS